MALTPSFAPDDYRDEARELIERIRAQNEPPDWKRVMLLNPALFLVHYFPHHVGKLEEFHLRLIDTATRRVRGLILYPAAHGKTTLTSELLPIWALCSDPNIRIQIVGKNDAEASSIMRVIQAELVDNDELVRDFGPFKPSNRDGKPWSTDELTILGRVLNHKSPTLAVFGSGAKTVLGRRTDWTICDDVVTDQNSATPEQRAKIREWFDLAVETGPEYPHSRLTVIGTLFDPGDLYNDLREMAHPVTGERIYHEQREDAIYEPEEQHKTLWPERWPYERLMEQKAKMGTLNFNKRYRNIAVDASRMVFREEYVKGGRIGKETYPGCLDKTYRIGDYDETWMRYAGFDPAVGLTKSAKFCAHIVIAVGSCSDHDRCFWVLDLRRDQMTLPQQADLIIAQHKRYDLFCSLVEANSYQGGLYQVVQTRAEKAGLAIAVEPHYTSKNNKPDPETGVQAMSPWFENGRVHIPWADPASRRTMQVLVDELVMYPGRTDDTIMAFWFAWRRAEEQGPKFRSFSRLDQRPSAQWVRRHSRRRVLLNPYWHRDIEADAS